MPSAAAISIIEFGRLIDVEAKRTDRDPTRVQRAEVKLIEQLSLDDNKHLKPALLFNNGNPLDAVILRILSLTAYLQICTNHLVTVTDVALAVADNEPCNILHARQVIAHLLYTKRLMLVANTDDQLELGEAMLTLLAGGQSALPVTMNQRTLHTQLSKIERTAAKRNPGLTAVPSAKWIYEELDRFVTGQHELKMALAVAGRQILLRRDAVRQKRRECLPPKPNVLIIGASGSGKSHACKTLSRILGLPFASLDCSQITASGYVGDDLSACLHLLAQSAAAIGVAPTDGGLIHLDEIDKISSSAYASPTTVGVQFEALRLLDGTAVSYPTNGLNKWQGTSGMMDTSNLLVVCSGAFSWLADDLEGRKSQLGFTSENPADGVPAGNLRELIVTRGGLIPEVVNRFSAIVKMDPLTPDDIAAILLSEHGTLGENRATLQTEGRTLVVEKDAALLIGQWSVAAGLMGRGAKAALELLLRDALFEGTPKDVIITAEAVRQKLIAH